ncbi:MAG: hypothetical protein ACWGQW_11500 [bacterium]
MLDIYRWYLDTDDASQIRFDHMLLAEEGDDLDKFDEVYELPHPEFFTCDLQFESASFNNFCFGDIQCGRYKGQKLIIEQNDGPLLMYWKACQGLRNRDDDSAKGGFE